MQRIRDPEVLLVKPQQEQLPLLPAPQPTIAATSALPVTTAGIERKDAGEGARSTATLAFPIKKAAVSPPTTSTITSWVARMRRRLSTWPTSSNQRMSVRNWAPTKATARGRR